MTTKKRMKMLRNNGEINISKRNESHVLRMGKSMHTNSLCCDNHEISIADAHQFTTYIES